MAENSPLFIFEAISLGILRVLTSNVLLSLGIASCPKDWDVCTVRTAAVCRERSAPAAGTLSCPAQRAVMYCLLQSVGNQRPASTGLYYYSQH